MQLLQQAHNAKRQVRKIQLPRMRLNFGLAM
jgi:hypothetical protein